MGVSFRPDSGTIGMDFTCRWCSRCKLDVNDDCEILAMTFAVAVDHPDYPREWTFERGEPVCMAFEAIDPLDQPQMACAAVRDLFPGYHRRPTAGEQVRVLVASLASPDAVGGGRG